MILSILEDSPFHSTLNYFPFFFCFLFSDGFSFCILHNPPVWLPLRLKQLSECYRRVSPCSVAGIAKNSDSQAPLLSKHALLWEPRSLREQAVVAVPVRCPGPARGSVPRHLQWGLRVSIWRKWYLLTFFAPVGQIIPCCHHQFTGKQAIKSFPVSLCCCLRRFRGIPVINILPARQKVYIRLLLRKQNTFTGLQTVV